MIIQERLLNQKSTYLTADKFTLLPNYDEPIGSEDQVTGDQKAQND